MPNTFSHDFEVLLKKEGLSHLYNFNPLEDRDAKQGSLMATVSELGDKYINMAIKFKGKSQGNKILEMFDSGIRQLFAQRPELYEIRSAVISLINQHAGKENKSLFERSLKQVQKEANDYLNSQASKVKILLKIDQKIVEKIDHMDQAKTANIARQDNKELAKLIKEHRHFRKAAGKTYELGENSKIYKLLMSGNENTIARLIESLSKSQKTSDNKEVTLIPEALIKHSPPELLLKMNEIAQKTEERRNGKVSSLRDGLNKLCNGLKAVFGLSIGGNDIKDAIKELEKVSVKFQKEKNDAKKTPQEENLKAKTSRFTASLKDENSREAPQR